jgi:1-acyl-sn-glycerol-3-phosphate acyltransferase
MMSDTLMRPTALPRWGQRTSLRLLNLLGWQLYYKSLPGPHGIAVVYPHTSNYDFFIGLLGKWALGLQFRWMGKSSLFRGPMGPIMRSLGGIAVDRRAPTGATRLLAEHMLAEPWCWIGITPEGTRDYRPHWKSGFYHLAGAAKVPLLLVRMDYGKKELRLTDVIHPTGNQQADMAAIAAVYEGVQGLYPEQAAPIQLALPHTGPERRKDAR